MALASWQIKGPEFQFLLINCWQTQSPFRNSVSPPFVYFFLHHTACGILVP